MNKIISFLTTYPIRLALIACVIAVLVALVNYMSGAPDGQVQQLNDKIEKLRKAINTNPPPAGNELKYSEIIRARWEQATAPQESNNWLMYYQPVWRVAFKKDVVIRTEKPNLPPVFKSAATVADKPDRVVLTWSKNENSKAEIKSYRVYRKAAQDKDFGLIIELPADTITPTDGVYVYEDKPITPTTEFAYQLTAYTETPNAPKKESEPSNQFKVTTLDNLKIGFIFAEIDPLPRMQCKIEKYVDGQWRNKRFIVNKGEKMGAGEFATDYTLTDIKETTREEIMEPGKPPRIIKVPKIIYTDRNNNVKEYEFPIKQ
ncbi:MAG: hypothetical protein HY762_09040 [Planctomycetes bacterium]|nr:hypothetical protein [Planctomycetota bacterium]